MGLSDIQNTACLCSAINALGTAPKEALKQFVTAAQSILAASKAVWLLVNSPIEDEIYKASLELILAAGQQVVAPLEASLAVLTRFTAASADCPPINLLGRTVKDISDFIMGPIDSTEAKIQNVIDSIEINQAYTDRIDRMISVLDDIIDAIDNC